MYIKNDRRLKIWNWYTRGRFDLFVHYIYHTFSDLFHKYISRPVYGAFSSFEHDITLCSKGTMIKSATVHNEFDTRPPIERIRSQTYMQARRKSHLFILGIRLSNNNWLTHCLLYTGDLDFILMPPIVWILWPVSPAGFGGKPVNNLLHHGNQGNGRLNPKEFAVERKGGLWFLTR